MDAPLDAYLLDWLNLLLRWAHVVFAIAWIGSSFYFVWLDNHLVPVDDEAARARGVTGELWAVHGGGFYNPQKYAVGPRRMPDGTLHWFFWESYATWLSGFALFCVLYLWNAATFLVDPRVFAWPSARWAGAAALGFLVAGWVVYDGICRLVARMTGAANGGVGDGRVVGVLVALGVAVSAWGACHLFAGRAAFLLVGAILATLMSANVLLWIIPGQRQVVASLRAGESPDPVHGQRGKQRSVHNTFFTLPVLLAMLSNHYGLLYGARHNWLVLIALMAVGAMARLWFVQRHKKQAHWALPVACVLVLGALGWTLRPQAPAALTTPAAPAGRVAGSPGAGANAAGAAPTFMQARAVVQQRCVMCHNAQLASKGVRLDEPAQMLAHAQQILQQAVIARTMPLNNATQITDDERALLGRWVSAGARAD